jgi:DNA replication and repair protein RecF
VKLPKSLLKISRFEPCIFDWQPVILPILHTLFGIHHIELIQFRNYSSLALDFKERIVACCGNNGTGKTNLLDAIYYMGFTKSYFNKPDAVSSEHPQSGFRINGRFSFNENPMDVSILLRENGKKELLVDQSPVQKFSDHFGKVPMVFIAPDDTKLITGSSEERRSFIDTLIAQYDHDYLMHLIKYNKALLERNKFLKQIQFQYFDQQLLDTYDELLQQHGVPILQKRLDFCQSFFPKILQIFAFLSDEKETPSISYQSSTTISSYLDDIKRVAQKDIALQRTTIGIHRDDIEMEMNGLPFKQTASQGQKKSMLFACKLASFEVLHDQKGFEPILLLDDIFEKLDQHRLKRLMEWVCIHHKGQVFMTDTHVDRMKQLLNDISLPFQTINL